MKLIIGACAAGSPKWRTTRCEMIASTPPTGFASLPLKCAEYSSAARSCTLVVMAIAFAPRAISVRAASSSTSVLSTVPT